MEKLKDIVGGVIAIVAVFGLLVLTITGTAMVAGFWGAVALDVGLSVFEWLR